MANIFKKMSNYFAESNSDINPDSVSKAAPQPVKNPKLEKALDIIEKSFDKLFIKVAALDKKWHLSESDFQVDMEKGTISFSSEGKKAIGDIQVVGSYDTNKGTFMWGWDHPSVPKKLQKTALLLKKWGAEHDMLMFGQQLTPLTEQMAWQMAALGSELDNSDCAYRAPAGSTLIFLTVSNLRKN